MKFLLLLAMALSLAVSAAENGLKLTFSSKRFSDGIPEKWGFQGKFFTNKPVYKIVKDRDGQEVLRISVNKASGTILYDISGILEKYPIMRWKWKVNSLPANADGRDPDRDDQVIAVYVGYGKLGSDSVAYRWETETPKGTKGQARYGGGMVKVNWVALRSKADKTGIWYTEEVNAAEDLKKILGGKLPDNEIAVSISSNSQYTKTAASAELAWIEFLPRKAAKK